MCHRQQALRALVSEPPTPGASPGAGPRCGHSEPPSPASSCAPSSLHLRTFLGPLLAPPRPCTFVGPRGLIKAQLSKEFLVYGSASWGTASRAETCPMGRSKPWWLGRCTLLPGLIKTRPECVAL